MDTRLDGRARRLDLAARAAWLYYIKRRTQDEIAADLAVSRPSAQRLVALAISEGLIKFRLDHPLLRSMELAERLREKFGLATCEVAPSAPAADGDRSGVAVLAAQVIEGFLAADTPQVLALGTGRTLLEAIRQVTPMERPAHTIVSVVGSLTASGRASPYDVVTRLAGQVGAQCYPLPLPVVTDTPEENAFLKAQRGYRSILTLFGRADAVMLGVGSIGTTAPLLLDGFVTPAEIAEWQRAGAVGEVQSWPIDAKGRTVASAVTDRLTALPLLPHPRCPTFLVASGRAKVDAIEAALRGGIGTGLITDEIAATRLLDHRDGTG